LYSAAYVWAKILAQLESRLTAPVVSTWFDDAEVISYDGKTLKLYTPSEYRRDIITRRGIAYIQEAMSELFDQDVEVTLLTDEEFAARNQAAARPDVFQFNPQFTFEKFVVGSSNRFAHAAALAVAKMPAETYNPLLIYGPSGLGKTHLLYAIANRIREEHPDYKIVYIKGDQFTNELISALQEGKNVQFRDKYRNADLFLMDDIQFIASKASTQEEFFHTFNNLWENHKQIVLTSDRPPKEMNTLEDRLRTRFEWGLIADIAPPDYETRVAIIRNKALEQGLDFDDDVASYIAENITNNIRQIEGTVKRIRAMRDLEGQDVNLNNVERFIRDMFKGKDSTLPTPELIIGEVSRFYNIDPSVIRSTQKNKNTAEARQIAMYLIRSMTNLSLPDIGREFGRDHSTVIHSLKKVEKDMAVPGSPLADQIRDITEAINNKL